MAVKQGVSGGLRRNSWRTERAMGGRSLPGDASTHWSAANTRRDRRERLEPLGRRAKRVVRAPERSTAPGFTGSVLGSVGGPVGATVGGLVLGTGGYVVDYTAAKAKEELEGSDGSKTVSIEIDVEEESGDSATASGEES